MMFVSEVWGYTKFRAKGNVGGMPATHTHYIPYIYSAFSGLPDTYTHYVPPHLQLLLAPTFVRAVA